MGKLVALGVGAILSIAQTRIIVSTYGIELMGIIAYVGGLVALFPFAGLGIGGTVTNAVAHGRPGLQRLSVMALVVLSLTGAILVAACVGLLALVDEHRVLSVAPYALPELGLAAVLAISAFAVSLPLGIGPALLLGRGEQTISIVAGVATSLLALLAVLGCSIAKAPAWLVPAIPLAAGLPTSGLLLVVAFRRMGWNARSSLRYASSIRLSESTSLLWSSGPFFIFAVVVPLFFSTQRLFVAPMGGQALAVFTLGGLTASFSMAALSSAGTALWPVLAADRGSMSTRRFKRLLMAFGGACLAGAVITVALSPFVAHLAGGADLDLPLDLTMSYGLAVLAVGLYFPAGMLLMKPPELRAQAWLAVATLAAYLALAWLFTPRLGIAGPVLATATAILVFRVGVTTIMALRMLKTIDPVPVTSGVVGGRAPGDDETRASS